MPLAQCLALYLLSPKGLQYKMLQAIVELLQSELRNRQRLLTKQIVHLLY
jgi:hypothetical protein